MGHFLGFACKSQTPEELLPKLAVQVYLSLYAKVLFIYCVVFLINLAVFLASCANIRVLMNACACFSCARIHICIVRLHTLELICQGFIIICCVVLLSECAIYLASIRLLMMPSCACISCARKHICIVRMCDHELICHWFILCHVLNVMSYVVRSGWRIALLHANFHQAPFVHMLQHVLCSVNTAETLGCVRLPGKASGVCVSTASCLWQTLKATASRFDLKVRDSDCLRQTCSHNCLMLA